MSLHGRLQDFLANEIAPHLERERIKEAHHEVRAMTRDILENVLVTSFVMGSYKRHTLIRRLSEGEKYDVDVMFVLNEEERLDTVLDTMESVAISLTDQIEDVVSYRRQRVSIGLIYNDNFSIDMVPGLLNEDGTYTIFDGREGNPVRTNPLKHIEVISGLNAANDGLFVPLIKLAKRWKQENEVSMKSFHIEMLAAKIFSDTQITDLTGALKKFFNEALTITANSTPIIDPVGGHDIAGYLDNPNNPQRTAAITALDKASTALDDAVRHENSEDDRLAERAMGRLYAYFQTKTDATTSATISTGLAASGAPKPWSA